MFMYPSLVKNELYFLIIFLFHLSCPSSLNYLLFYYCLLCLLIIRLFLLLLWLLLLLFLLFFFVFFLHLLFFLDFSLYVSLSLFYVVLFGLELVSKSQMSVSYKQLERSRNVVPTFCESLRNSRILPETARIARNYWEVCFPSNSRRDRWKLEHFQGRRLNIS